MKTRIVVAEHFYYTITDDVGQFRSGNALERGGVSGKIKKVTVETNRETTFDFAFGLE